MFLKTITGKKGSYILEAAISLPIFLIAVMVMSSVILMYSCIECGNFAAAGELRRGAAEAIYADTSVLIPYRIRSDISDTGSRVRSSRITDYGYRVSRWGQDELIAITMRMRLSSPNPLGIRSEADYDLSFVTRAYVGKIRNVGNMSADELAGSDAHAVYIFPKRGEKYHSIGCRFLTAASTSSVLNASITGKYKPCPICGSGKASRGTRIYYFPSAGEDYHLAGCPSLERNYVEIDRKDAEARGYTPCAVCGG